MQSEHGCAFAALNGAASAMRLRDRVDYREPEPGASLLAAACRIGASEALEDPVDAFSVDAASVVDDLDHDLGTPR
jgi:hypothetical protein